MPVAFFPPRALVVLLCALAPLSVRAAHPLITEDTGTQGQGRFQLDLTREHATIRRAGANQSLVLTGAVFAYGVEKNTDVILTLPYLRRGDSVSGGSSGEKA